jgi:hypothetical protein
MHLLFLYIKIPSLYLLTTCSTVLFEDLTSFSQLTKKFPAFYGTRRIFFTVLTSARHLSLSWANSIQSPRPPPTSSTSTLILSSHLRLGLPNGLFTSGFPTNTLCNPSFLPNTRHMSYPSHHSRFHHPHNIGRGTHIIHHSPRILNFQWCEPVGVNVTHCEILYFLKINQGYSKIPISLTLLKRHTVDPRVTTGLK